MRRLLRTSAARFGYRITRERPDNRFQAMASTLSLMRARGYQPQVVIDSGANAGEWTQLAHGIFPEAAFHLVEPQVAYTEMLEQLVTPWPGCTVYPVALSAPGIDRVRLIGARPEGCTGSFVASPGESSDDEVSVPAATLDALFADGLSRHDRTLLKLDVEGHEMAVLRGADRVLSLAEVLLVEVRFYDIDHTGRAIFADVLAYLRAHGFELDDIAALSPRPRDSRLRQGDIVFVRRDSPLHADDRWA